MLIGIFTGVLLLVLLTIAVKNNHITNVDTKILNFFHSIESPGLDIFFNAFTLLGSLWILIPLSIVFTIGLLFNAYVMAAIIFNVGLVLSIGTTYAMKFVLERKRPELFEVIGEMPHNSSYPSAHTTQAFAFALMLGIVTYMLNPSSRLSLSIVFLSFALVVATSRMYLQIHFPSDVLAGILVASIWAGIIMYIIKLGVFA